MVLQRLKKASFGHAGACPTASSNEEAANVLLNTLYFAMAQIRLRYLRRTRAVRQPTLRCGGYGGIVVILKPFNTYTHGLKNSGLRHP